jgi:serine/threonine-protein kinase
VSLPSRIARYDIVGRLASGGMAEILLARLTGPSGFERAVVVKRILPHLAAEESFRTMFLDEARIVARIRHANVVQVQELGQDGEELYLAMEYLEGESASAILRRVHRSQTHLDMTLAAYIVAEACAGLHAAHELRGPSGEPLHLVHRDVSPQNVFVTYGGEVKLLDFGIAKAADSTARTETGTFKGKFEYASPEQCLGQPLDRRTDIFAMGVVLFELTTARRLFKRENQLLTMRAITRGEVPNVSAIVPDYPPALERIWRKALAVEGDKRYATAAEMRRELLTVARDLGLDPEPEVAVGRVMHELFGDRIEVKEDLLRRVRGGTEVGPLPPNEIDVQVEVPVAEPTLRVTATLETPTTPTPTWRERKALYGAAAIGVLGVLFASVSLLRPKDVAPAAAEPIPATAPGPPTTAEAATVLLSVESTPPGAEVLIAGQQKGKTPAAIVLERSSAAVTVEVRMAGYAPRTQEVVPNVDQKIVLGLAASAPAGGAQPAHPRTRSTPAVPKTKSSEPSEPFRRFE